MSGAARARLDAPAIHDAPPALHRTALKEWAAVDRALAAGATVLLLRKGGIYEQRHGFRVENRDFWLFPTRFHQAAEELEPAFEWTLDAARELEPDTGRAPIATFARVTDAFRVDQLGALDRIAGLHPLAQPTVHARFHYRGRPYVHVLLVRAYTLPRRHEVRLMPEYEGCVSWVQLHEPLPTRGLSPVLGDVEFALRRTEALERLASAGMRVRESHRTNSR